MIRLVLVLEAFAVPHVELFNARNTYGGIPIHPFKGRSGGTFPLLTTMPTRTALVELAEIILIRPNKVPLSSPV